MSRFSTFCPPDETVPGGDGLVARFGGEELAVLVRDTDLASATALGECLRCRVGDLAWKRPTGIRLTITASIGVAVAIGDEMPRDLLRHPDEAPYAATSQGRDRVVVHTGRGTPARGR